MVVLRDVALAAVTAFLVYFLANQILIQAFQQHIENPKVFREHADASFASLQEYVTENQISSDQCQKLTRWNDEHYYVSMLIKDPLKMCYNSFVSYNMYYEMGPEDQKDDSFQWGSKELPVHFYSLQFTDETAEVILSGYFDIVYEGLRKSVCAFLFLFAFLLVFFILFHRNIQYIQQIEEGVKMLCNRDYSSPIPATSSTELASLAENINILGETMEENQKKEALYQSRKDRFVKSIAHDLRTPLTAVIGYLELLEDQAYGSDEAIRSALVSRALSRADYMKSLTNAMFDMDAVGNDIWPEFALYDGNELMAQIALEAAELLEDGDGRKDACRRILYKNAVNQPFSARTDIDLLHRLLDNLCSNIIRHADLKQPVIFRVWLDESTLVIRQSNKIQTSPDQLPGDEICPGIGLSTCRQIMNLHGGSLHTSIVGSRFSITLRFPASL